MATTEFIAAIELGSSRIAGIAGRKHADGSLEVLAYAREDSSTFVRKGQVYNIDKAAHAIHNIVSRLEEQLHHSIAQVYAGIGGQSLRTAENQVSRLLDEEGIISDELVDELCYENRDLPLSDMCVLDVAPQEYKIDNTLHADPVGVTGRSITGRYQNIIARHALKKNLEQSFEKASVKIAGLLVSPLALAPAVLTENEMRAGCALVDLGAATTTVQVYKNNILRYLCVLPLGGNNISHDLTGLKIEETEAEDLKLRYGDALYKEDENGSDAPASCLLNDGRAVKLGELNDIVGARAEEIMSNAWNQIQLSGYENELFSGVVLTGGNANLPNTEALFRSLSHTDKVRTAAFVQEVVSGYDDDLTHDGRQNTLLGLLVAGTENCCTPEKPQPAPQPTQASLGFDNPAPAPQPAEPKPEPQPEPEPAPQPEPKKEPQPKPEPEPKSTTTKKKKRWWQMGKDLFDDLKNEALGDTSDSLKN